MKKKEKHGYEKHKTQFGKFWHFIWHEDSLASYVVSIILIVLLGKFVILPIIGAIFGTSFPLVAVISSSMDHQGQEFDEWWAQNGQWYSQNSDITKEQFESFYRSQGFQKGDVLAILGVDISEVEVGDVIVYSVPNRGTPIIHRVVNINEDGTLETKGDANFGQISFEKSITQEQLQGRAVFLIPKIGWVKVIFVDIFQ